MYLPELDLTHDTDLLSRARNVSWTYTAVILCQKKSIYIIDYLFTASLHIILSPPACAWNNIFRKWERDPSNWNSTCRVQMWLGHYSLRSMRSSNIGVEDVLVVATCVCHYICNPNTMYSLLLYPPTGLSRVALIKLHAIFLQVASTALSFNYFWIPQNPVDESLQVFHLP